MNVQALLGSAVIAALISVVGGVVTKMVVDARLNRELESLKSDLSVWAVFRNETIRQMWVAHREMVGAMTDTILKVQELQSPARIGEASTAVEAYRRLIHKHIDLLPLPEVDICQRFLNTAYAIASGDEPANDANSLKAIRREFYEHMARFFHLQDVMPWIAPPAGPSAGRPG